MRDALGGSYSECPEPRTPKWAIADHEEGQQWQVDVEGYAMALSRGERH